MRKALIVGINNYQHVPPLYGCVSDALAMKNILERHGDGSVNFHIQCLITENCDEYIIKASLIDGIEDLFKDDSDIALLYFAGHGYVDNTGGYIVTSDYETKGDGIPLDNIMTWINGSPAKNKGLY